MKKLLIIAFVFAGLTLVSCNKADIVPVSEDSNDLPVWNKMMNDDEDDNTKPTTGELGSDITDPNNDPDGNKK